MWNKSKSITLTHLLVRACYVFLAITAIGLPILLRMDYLELTSTTVDYFTYTLLAVVPAGYLALICLDMLLINVKKEMVFNEKNVKLLRIISWACFYAGSVGILSFVIVFIKYLFLPAILIPSIVLVLAVAEMFMGLVVRVVKNVFEAAIEIKEENELTI